MRSHREVNIVLKLVALGFSDAEIAERTRIPRRTVLDWRHGRLPRGGRDWSCDFANHLPLPVGQYVYLLGLYLGDGWLSEIHRGVWRLRVAADARYPGIIEERAAAMEAIFPRQRAHRLRRRHSRCAEISMYSKHWLCLFPQHGKGRKHRRVIRLAGWQREIVEQAHEKFLRGLIHSDGCRIIAHERQSGRVRDAPRYIFSNRSEDIRSLFCESCDALGIGWTRPSDKEIAIYRLESVARLDEFIGPKS